MKVKVYLIIITTIFLLLSLCSCLAFEESFEDLSVGQTTSPGIDGFVLKLHDNFGIRIEGEGKDEILSKHIVGDTGTIYSGDIKEVYSSGKNILLVTNDEYKYILIYNDEHTKVEYYNTLEEVEDIVSLENMYYINLNDVSSR